MGESGDGPGEFDPKALADAARGADLSRHLGPEALRRLDPAALEAVQAANLAALTTTQRTAAAAYQSAFETELNALAEMFAQIEAQMEQGGETAQLTAAAYERALTAFQALSAEAMASNGAAFRALSDHIAAAAAALKADEGA